MQSRLNFVSIGALVILSALLASTACSAPQHEGFAIYLTEADVPPAQMPVLSHVDLAAQPIVAVNDIVTYDSGTHEMVLTVEAYDRICNLEVPVSGRSFVVCVDKQPAYSGAFCTIISSMSFDGVTIWKPLTSSESHVIQLQHGYPSPGFSTGDDARDNADVLQSLREAGKLTTGSEEAPVVELPTSMKGYELYSWREDGEWHFTLITGTNRNKTLDEVVSPGVGMSDDGWVQIHIIGAETIKSVLSGLPDGENVFWFPNLPTEEASGEGVSVTLPPTSIVNDVKAYAESRGLNLHV